jgi:hypothetical protein
MAGADTMGGAAATTVGVADIGAIVVTVMDGDSASVLGGHMGGDIRMVTATAPGGMLPTLIITIALRAIHVHTTGTTTILPRQIPARTPGTTRRNLGGRPCRKAAPTQTT